MLEVALVSLLVSYCAVDGLDMSLQVVFSRHPVLRLGKLVFHFLLVRGLDVPLHGPQRGAAVVALRADLVPRPGLHSLDPAHLLWKISSVM